MAEMLKKLGAGYGCGQSGPMTSGLADRGSVSSAGKSRWRTADRAHRPQIAGRAERLGVGQILRRPVDPGALRPVERHLFPVHGGEILAEEDAQMLQPVAQAPDDREIAADGVLGLGDIDEVENGDQQNADADGEDEQRRHDGEEGRDKAGQIESDHGKPPGRQPRASITILARRPPGGW
jgi:hypothetical protein